MRTERKFLPKDAELIRHFDEVALKIRLLDCEQLPITDINKIVADISDESPITEVESEFYIAKGVQILPTDYTIKADLVPCAKKSWKKWQMCGAHQKEALIRTANLTT